MTEQILRPAFNPANSPAHYKKALSRYSTGVTIITTSTPDGPIGITANSFASISLSPALIMWAPAKSSSRHDAFVAAEAFAVHILSFSQKEICNAFVHSKSAFETVDYKLNKDGVPIIAGSLAIFECKRYQTHEAGDHTMILGEVHTAHEQDGQGLVFANGAFVPLG